MARLDDIRLSFNEVPDIYDEIRPSYPEAMFEALFDMLPPHPALIEVGPGTGQATKHLLARGASVHAIEIGPATAAKLRSKLPTPRLQVTVGDFEKVEIAPHSAGALFSAAAYHWIAPQMQVDRPAQVVRGGGLIAIVDLIQVASEEDEGFFERAQPTFERFGQGHKGPPTPLRSDVDPPIRAVLEADDRYSEVAVRRYDWNQTYRAEDYRKLMLSDSPRQMMDPADRLGLLDAIESLIHRDFGGKITRPLVATMTTAVVEPQAAQ